MTPSLSRLIFAAAFSGIACVCAGDWRDAPPAGIRAGDIAFRSGNGPWTRFFVGASSRDKRFSHVGIVVPAPGCGVAIVHSEAGDFSGKGNVRADSWKVFFDGATDGAVYRPVFSDGAPESIVSCAMSRMGVVFDKDFDLSDTNRLYCSEFVREAVNEAAGRKLIGTTRVNGRDIVAIDDIYCEGFEKVFDFQRPNGSL